MTSQARIRVSIKAIIVVDGKLLVVRNEDDVGPWYALPGGGQDVGETVPAALARECQEEVGADVTVGRLRFVRDYIAAHHEFAATSSLEHQLELMFECELRSPPVVGSRPDEQQTGIAWLALADLEGARLYPAVLRRVLPRSEVGIYLGDVN